MSDKPSEIKVRVAKTPPNLFDAARDLYDACQVALIVINEAALARGVMYGDEKKAIEQIVLALRDADGDTDGSK